MEHSLFINYRKKIVGSILCTDHTFTNKRIIKQSSYSHYTKLNTSQRILNQGRSNEIDLSDFK